MCGCESECELGFAHRCSRRRLKHELVISRAAITAVAVSVAASVMPTPPSDASNSSSSQLALFFAKFDNHFGRTLTYQEPRDAISSDEFDAIAEYLIPKPQLCNKLSVLRGFHGRTVLCWPVCLEATRYERNALLFALGFVHGDDSADDSADFCERYGNVLNKACGHLAALELESSLISDATREGDLAHLLPQVLRGLRERGVCSVRADAANTIHLRLPPPRRSSNPAPTDTAASTASSRVDEGMVPVFIAPYDLDAARRWDLSLQKLLPWIDGTRTVASIASHARADLSLVTQGLKALSAAGWVRLLDGFDLKHSYACTPRLNTIANDQVARERLADAVAAGGGGAEERPPTWGDVLRLYAAFKPSEGGWRTVRQVIDLYPALASRVDLRMLVYAGQLNGLLRRVGVEKRKTPRLPVRSAAVEIQ